MGQLLHHKFRGLLSVQAGYNNEAHGRAANYTFSNGVISNAPHIGHSLFTTNHAKFLPRIRLSEKTHDVTCDAVCNF